MSKTNQAVEALAVQDVLKSFEGDVQAYRRLFESVGREVPCAQVVMISTLPRGGTQMIQPLACPESLLKAYNRGSYIHDRATWQTLLQREVLTSEQVWPEGLNAENAFYSTVLQPHGLEHGAFALVADPVLPGYPGVLHVYRAAGEPAFTQHELTQLQVIAQELSQGLHSLRQLRQRHPDSPTVAPWDNAGNCRQFIFDRSVRQVSLYLGAGSIDEPVAAAIKKTARHQFDGINGQLVTIDRLEAADTHGEVWAFRVTVFKSYPALGNGPFIFFCLQPQASEWNVVRASDVAADQELSRLIPTLKFMQAEFHRMPTLDEIAAKAHLSPFHFHRRFTELLGQTPKHFLLSCQIQQAKRMLMERKVPLSEIAAGCGFAHQSHFTSRFKQATGLTPTRWRRHATDAVKLPSEESGCTV